MKTLIFVAVATLAPLRALADDTPSFERYQVYDPWNAPLVATGAFVFTASYGASVGIAATSSHSGADRLWVPLAGPWLALNDWGDCPIASTSCDRNTSQKVLLVADGILQAGGVITIAAGLFSPTHHTVYMRVAKNFDIAPTHDGFVVFGRF